MRTPLPGSKHVMVEHSKAHDYIDLFIENPPMRAHVERNMFYILIDSRKLAPDFMVKDEAMTKNLQYAHKICDDGFYELMENWVIGKLDCSGDRNAPEKGPKDWSPLTGAKRFRRRGRVLKHENTYNLEGTSYWQGGVYEYLTFKLPGGKDAMAVFWHLGGDPRGNYDEPEVWVGDVEGFLDAQKIDLENTNTMDSLDEEFGGGLVWAVEELNLLKSDESDIPGRLRELIENRPQLLSDRTLEKIKRHPERFAPWVRSAVDLL